MNRERLDPQQLADALERLPLWEVQEAKLHRDYVFTDFLEAFQWMTRVAEEAERLCHHPDWSNVYNRVGVDLWTHDRDGITELDVALAGFMESTFEALAGSDED